MKTVAISTALLTRLVDRLEARVPAPTNAFTYSGGQLEANERIERDVALIDEARHLLRPRFQKTVNEFAAWSLEEMRMGREVALKNGNMNRALALATAIDIKKGLYK